MAGFATVNGVLVPLESATVPLVDLGLQRGWSVFETVDVGFGPDHLDRHLARLAGSAKAMGVEMPDLDLIRSDLARVVEATGGRCWARITLTASGRRLVQAEPADLSRWHAPVRCATGPHVPSPFVGGATKHGSRGPWEAFRARLDVDDVLFVDDEGRFTEGTRCGVLAVVAGRLLTAAWDDRILESTTVTRLLGHAERLSVEIVRQGAVASEPFDALYVASTTRSLAPVVELDGRPLPAWDRVGLALRDAEQTYR